MEIANNLREKARFLALPADELLALFMKAFEAGDLDWIQMLSCLFVMLPDDQQVAYYREQYRLAILGK